MHVRGETYHVTYDPIAAIVAFEGAVRLHGIKDYDRVKQLIDDVVAAAPDSLVLDLRALGLLNSVGLYLLREFVLKMRDHTRSRMTVQGMAGVYWQKKTFEGFVRLMPRLELKWEAQDSAWNGV